MASAVYQFYTRVSNDSNHSLNDAKSTLVSFVCSHCEKIIKTMHGTTSNLIKHLDRANHKTIKNEYLKIQATYDSALDENRSLKKRKLFSDKVGSPLLSTVGVTKSPGTPKYGKNSQLQKLHYNSLLSMLVKCMLPVSIVENPAFRDWMDIIDPSFRMPSRNSIKVVGIPKFRENVKNKIKNTFNSIPWLNVSCDGWSDYTMRCFNGYIGQGIDDDWNMVCIPFAFQPVTGSHTGQAIKTQYNKVVDEFGIKEKVFKIVTDSAANNKSAFKDQVEASDESHILAKLMLKQKKRDLYHKNKELLKQKENLAVAVLEAEIEEANKFEEEKNDLKACPKTAEQVWLDLENEEDDETDEITDTYSICDSTDSEEEQIDRLLEMNNEAAIQIETDDSSFAEKLVSVEEALHALEAVRDFNLPLIVTLQAVTTAPETTPDLMRQLLDFDIYGSRLEAIGFSCAQPEAILECLIAIEDDKDLSEKLKSSQTQLAVLPNLNDTKDFFEYFSKFTTLTIIKTPKRDEMHDETSSLFITFCNLLIEHGSTYIGACCGSTPKNIDSLKQYLNGTLG